MNAKEAHTIAAKESRRLYAEAEKVRKARNKVRKKKLDAEEKRVLEEIGKYANAGCFGLDILDLFKQENDDAERFRLIEFLWSRLEKLGYQVDDCSYRYYALEIRWDKNR